MLLSHRIRNSACGVTVTTSPINSLYRINTYQHQQLHCQYILILHEKYRVGCGDHHTTLKVYILVSI